MPEVADETAYYLNRKVPVVALVTNGVRFPAGTWMRVASASTPTGQVEQILANVFPDLKGKMLTFVTLTSESEVEEFERSFLTPRRSRLPRNPGAGFSAGGRGTTAARRAGPARSTCTPCHRPDACPRAGASRRRGPTPGRPRWTRRPGSKGGEGCRTRVLRRSG